ncbi:MAG: nucleotide exchange factor GrpE [Parahaliea sp.]
MIAPDRKAELLAQFHQHLEEEAAGIGAVETETGTTDLFTLFTELAELKNEIRLESRQIKQALDQSREVIDGLHANNRQLKEELARRRKDDSALRQHMEQPLLLEILELRDRMEAARSGLRERRAGWLARWSGKHRALVTGIGEGMDIMLRRLDSLLGRYQVSALNTLGDPIDPHSMRVCGTEACDDTPEGTVVTEVRRGFRRGDHILRPAEVIVSKKAVH